MRAAAVILAAGFLCTVAVNAQAPAPAQAPRAAAAAPAGDVQKGKALYTAYYCYTCHGTTGQGGAGVKIAPNPVSVHGRAKLPEKAGRRDAPLHRQARAGRRRGRYLRVPQEHSRRAAVEEHSAPEPVVSADPGRGSPPPGSRYNRQTEVSRTMSRPLALILAGFCCAIAALRPSASAAPQTSGKETELPLLWTSARWCRTRRLSRTWRGSA